MTVWYFNARPDFVLRWTGANGSDPLDDLGMVGPLRPLPIPPALLGASGSVQSGSERKRQGRKPGPMLSEPAGSSRACGLAQGEPAQPAGGGAWLCFPTGAAGMSSGHGGGRQAARGWFPDGRSGLPAVDSRAPPASAAPTGLIQLCLARSGMPAMPKLPCHQCPPHSLCTGHSAFPLSFISIPSTRFPEVQRFRARNRFRARMARLPALEL